MLDETRTVVINDKSEEEPKEETKEEPKQTSRIPDNLEFGRYKATENYVLYIDPNNETGEVLVSSYTEEGTLEDITDEDEWAMIEEVFNTFVIEEDGEEA